MLGGAVGSCDEVRVLAGFLLKAEGEGVFDTVVPFLFCLAVLLSHFGNLLPARSVCWELGFL